MGEKLETKIAVIVTTAHRGVFFGYIAENKIAERDLELDNCRNVIYWSAKTGGFLGLAAEGPASESRIGKVAQSVLLHDVTSVSRCTEQAEKTFVDWK